MAIIDDAGASSLTTIAAGLGIPAATAYRLVASLVDAQMVLAVGGGRHLPGPGLALRLDQISLRPALLALGRPVVARLSRKTGSIAHLGVLENDMVTYLIKAGRRKHPSFTAEGKQLEAYCSGIGKILLAALPESALTEYLKAGPFVPLTENTITDPARLRAEIDAVRRQGFARDTEEIAHGLFCISVGINGPDGRALAALSISRTRPDRDEAGLAQSLSMLREGAAHLEQRLFGCGSLEPLR
ncbi:MAG: IclR family transcriptional regulator [Rhodospirillaceae bacterium]|nr:IclR family transcriptional regulator [Rhodospirillaceae bacterium]